MLCDRVIGNLSTLPPGGRTIPLDLTWQQCFGRTLKKVLPDGRTVRMILPPGTVLQPGDVIFDDGQERIAIHLLPCEVLIAQISDPAKLARVLYELGNLHAPVELMADKVVTIPDGPVEAALRQFGVAYETANRPFCPLPLPNGEAFRLAIGFSVSRSTRA